MNTIRATLVGVALAASAVMPARGQNDPAGAPGAHPMTKQHQAMLEAIRADTAETASWTGRRDLSPRVWAAMAKVERHRFVPEAEAPYAYLNRPRPIGHGQTISQPFIVAYMTEQLGLRKTDRVLEIGTGSGYQAAVIAEIADSVYSIEIVPPLAEQAAGTLGKLGYRVRTRSGDGYLGWPEGAPFDAIIITAAPPEIPEPLIRQLAPGGRMIVPVGVEYQELVLIHRDEKGGIRKERLIPVRFVPMTGKIQEQ